MQTSLGEIKMETDLGVTRPIVGVWLAKIRWIFLPFLYLKTTRLSTPVRSAYEIVEGLRL